MENILENLQVGLFVVIMLIFILIIILRYQFGIDFDFHPTIRRIVAAGLAASSIGSVAAGIVGILRKRGCVYILLLVLSLFTLLFSMGMMFNIGA